MYCTKIPFNSVFLDVASSGQGLDGVHLSVVAVAVVVLRLCDGSTDEQCHEEDCESEHLKYMLKSNLSVVTTCAVEYW